jgi:hypothetical protein
MGAQYFLHGDRDRNSADHFYCKKCDLFVTEDHFNDEKHKSEKECLIRRGLLYLTDSQAALRQNDWFNLFDRAVLNEKYKLEQVSRRKTCRTSLPDSIRYSILKSDNYKCRICGRSASDGAKLHFDHKIPVSKGGTNDPDNLWTLCERCNLGKSDHYI